MSRVIGLFALLCCLAFFAAPAAAQTYGTSPFEGAYVGGYAGGAFDPNAAVALGGMAGVNFEVSPGIIAGLEVQGGAELKSGSTTWEGLMLARGGGAVTPDAMVYGELGVGTVNSVTSWGVGLGGEAIVAPQIGVRGEVIGTGPWGSGLNRTKATAGLVWHMQ
ncbi:MAG: hypothetical protein KKH72_08470 [Alphaproteobacteria bacterium]|nr:hypothetical protein [Alphaproteobacteria bacterium]